MGTSRVYLCLPDDGDHPVGYFALAPHVLDRAEATSSIAHGAPSQIPAILLGRLALDATARGEGLGRLLLAVALTRAIEGMKYVGGRIVVVDAIDDEASGFYERYGFQAIPENPRRLVRKASDIAKSLELPWP